MRIDGLVVSQLGTEKRPRWCAFWETKYIRYVGGLTCKTKESAMRLLAKELRRKAHDLQCKAAEIEAEIGLCLKPKGKGKSK